MNVETLIVGAFGTNCLIVDAGGPDAVVVDPGGDAGQIIERLEETSRTAVACLLTHGHVDHVSAAAEICRHTGDELWLHPLDREWAFEPVNEMLPFYPAPAPPGTAIRDLADGQELEIAGMAFSVIETPGHTPGSVCFHSVADAVLLCGDTLFAGSVGRTDLPGGDARALGASLARLARLPDRTRVYPGHGPATTIGEEKRTNFFLQRLRMQP